MKAIILSCSSTKGAGPAPAIELYDGPRWRTLRAALRQVTVQPRVFAFSAEHGIIPGDTLISAYNQEFEKLAIASIRGLSLLDEFKYFHLSMGAFYARYLIPQLTTPYEWHGDRGIGDQRASIYRFLIKYEIENQVCTR